MKLIKFIIALLKFILYGEEVTQEEKNIRLNICNTCAFKHYNKCGKCGCYLDKKTSWSSESCPENKW